MTWNEGYVSELDYTYGVYQELSPNRLRLPFLVSGFRPPKIETACELGFGQGVSININAATSDVEWWGNDFNPNQALFASNLASSSGANIKISDESFELFCARDDLPQFDFIGLHGIWSWISDKNRLIIRDFLDKRLRVGGVVYIGYNVLPGWSAFAPVRNLLTEHRKHVADSSTELNAQILKTLTFAEDVLSKNPTYGRGSSLIQNRIDKMKKQSPSYLAHEYFNKDWRPMFFSEISEILNSAKLEYACSAHYIDLVDAVNLTEEQRGFLKNIKSVNFRETVRNFLTNNQFRRDYWVKGKNTLTPLQQIEQINDTEVLLTHNIKDFEYKVNGLLGEGSLNKEVYEPILSHLANYEPCKVGELHASLPNLGFNQLVQAITILYNNCRSGYSQHLR